MRKVRHPSSLSRRLLGFEALESRRLLAFGDVRQVLEPPGVLPQARAEFGSGQFSRFAIGAPRHDITVNGQVVRDAGRIVINGEVGVDDPHAAAGDRFGYAVAGEGYEIYASAPYDDQAGSDAGIVYLLTYNGHVQGTYTSPFPQANDRFGSSLVRLGNYSFAASAPGFLDSGTVFIFRGGSVITIPNPSPAPGDGFGEAMYAAGKSLFVGAPGDDTLGPDSGAVYVFDIEKGVLQNVILNPLGLPGDRFGASISGSLVGAPGRTVDGQANAGAAFIISLSQESIIQSFLNPSPNADDRFGAAVWLNGDVVVIGAPGDDDQGQDTGSVYVFDRDQGEVLLQTISSPHPSNGDQFGAEIGSSDFGPLIASPFRDIEGAVNAGSIYQMWLYAGELRFDDELHNITPAKSFGRAVALTDDYAFVLGSSSGEDTDILYQFDRPQGTLLRSVELYTRIARLQVDGDLLLVAGYGLLDRTSLDLVRLLSFEEMGHSVVLRGGKLVVANTEGTPSISIFEARTGTLLRTIFSHSPDVTLSPGRGLDVTEGKVVCIGSDASTKQEGLYLYDLATGTLAAHFSDDRIDYRLSGPILAGFDSIFVSAVGHYVYEFDAVSGALRRILGPQVISGREFGYSLTRLGDILAVGSPYDEGDVHLFAIGTGQFITALEHAPIRPRVRTLWEETSYFGSSVAMSQSTIAVSDSNLPGLIKRIGGVFLYDNDWNGFQIVTPWDYFNRDYYENAAPIPLLPDAAILDPGHVSLSGAQLLVTNQDATHEDRIRVVGNSRLKVSGADIFYDDVLIARSFGGSAAAPFEVTFYSRATLGAVKAVIRSLSFESVGDQITSGQRHYEVRFIDGDGESTFASHVAGLVNVLAIPDNPVLTLGGQIDVTENGPGEPLAPTATLSDLDSSVFNGTLTVFIERNASPGDTLSIRDQGPGLGHIRLLGSGVYYEDGQWSPRIADFSGGIDGTPLTIVLRSFLDWPSQAMLEALLRAIVFSTTSESEADRIVTFELTDGTGGVSDRPAVVVHVRESNDRPVITGFGDAVSYQENGPAVRIAGSVRVSDNDTPNFNSGRLTVGYLTGGSAHDRLLIQRTTALTTNVRKELFYNGTLIGTYSGGIGTTPLVVAFNEKVTPAIAGLLLRSIVYRNASDAPQATRTVWAEVTDGETLNGTSIAVTKLINVTPVKDAPVVNNFGGDIAYVEDGPFLRVADATATITDGDAEDFGGGTLTVTISAGAQPEDLLVLRSVGGISTNADKEVFYNSVKIGSYSGGTDTTALVVTFNADAKSSAVTAVLRSVHYRAASQNPHETNRRISAQVNDGHGLVSATVFKLLSVTATNDAPELKGFSTSPIGYTRNDAAVVALAPSAEVKDYDHSNFSGGKLIVRVVDGVDGGNRLSIAGPTYKIVDGYVLKGTTRIGQVMAHTSNKLEIKFNEQALVSRVQELIRAIRFKTVNSLSTADRTIDFTIRDSVDGGDVTQSVTVDVM